MNPEKELEKEMEELKKRSRLMGMYSSMQSNYAMPPEIIKEQKGYFTQLAELMVKDGKKSDIYNSIDDKLLGYNNLANTYQNTYDNVYKKGNSQSNPDYKLGTKTSLNYGLGLKVRNRVKGSSSSTSYCPTIKGSYGAAKASSSKK